jgi:hypothetical protein
MKKFHANRPALKNPDKIFVGQILRIPDVVAKSAGENQLLRARVRDAAAAA